MDSGLVSISAVICMGSNYGGISNWKPNYVEIAKRGWTMTGTIINALLIAGLSCYSGYVIRKKVRQIKRGECGCCEGCSGACGCKRGWVIYGSYSFLSISPIDKLLKKLFYL